MNLYAFVGNNPVNWVDPFGLYTDAATMQQIAIGGGGLAATLSALGAALTTSVSAMGAAAVGPAIAAGAFGWGVGTYINKTWIEPWLWNDSNDDVCDSGKVIPLPVPYEEEIEISLDLPSDGGDDGGRKKRCNAARWGCFAMAVAMNDIDLMDLCEESYKTCKDTNIPTIFPDGTVVR